MHPLVLEDIQNTLKNNSVDWDSFRNKTFLITGSTGLIGSLLCHLLLQLGDTKLILPVRSTDKAKAMLGESDSIEYITVSDIAELPEINEHIDYILHCASPTRSKFFIEQPVETLDSILLGTKRLLDIAKKQSVTKFLYLSSMEMYGTYDGEVTETVQGFIDPLDPRSSYSLGKRAAELYCKSYYVEYGTPIVNARLAMCFGAGIPLTDNRVVKSFCDLASNNQNIVIKSDGKTVLNYSYTADALLGIMTLLQKSTNGEAYNICNDFENYTIAKLAQTIASFSDQNIEVIIENNLENTGFAPNNSMILKNDKLKALGWAPQHNTAESLRRTYDYIKTSN